MADSAFLGYLRNAHAGYLVIGESIHAPVYNKNNVKVNRILYFPRNVGKTLIFQANFDKTIDTKRTEFCFLRICMKTVRV